MRPDILLKARNAIGDCTPMLRDCGMLCQAACCQPDADGQGGVHLFPGEEALLSDCAWGRIVHDAFAPMLVCEGMCQRDARPLGCRIFPLTPVRGKNGKWTVRMDVRARAMCPLAAHGLSGLDPAFPRAVRDALRIVAEDPEGYAFLEKWAALEAQYRQPLW
jgi:hypothetical protein